MTVKISFDKAIIEWRGFILEDVLSQTRETWGSMRQ